MNSSDREDIVISHYIIFPLKNIETGSFLFYLQYGKYIRC